MLLRALQHVSVITIRLPKDKRNTNKFCFRSSQWLSFFIYLQVTKLFQPKNKLIEMIRIMLPWRLLRVKVKMLMLPDRGSLQPRPSVLPVEEKMLMLPEGGRTKIYPILASAALTLFLILPQVTVKSLLIFDSKLIIDNGKDI